MKTDDAALQSYYAARASEYDRIYEKPERQADLQHLRHWLPSVFAGMRVLEVACGTGYWTQFIAASATQVMAIDAAPETLAIARRRAPERKVDFLVGDAYELPQDQRPFDAAFAGFWFSHVPKARQRPFLAGLGAMLGPGATVLLLDNRYVAGSSSPISERDDDGNTYQVRRLDDGTLHRVLKNFPTGAELCSLIHGLGHEPHFTSLDYYWTFQYTTPAR